MSNPVSDYDVVVIIHDVPDHGLVTGHIGVVLLTHAGHGEMPPAYTVEVTTLPGETVAVVDVPADLVRPVSDRDVCHARPSPLRS